MESIVLASGCFWCLEAAFQLIKGVEKVEPGYSGGREEDADYATVSSGQTGHAESVRVTFNPEVISLKDILDIFWVIHDPTTTDRQGNDIGRQYRSAIFYANETQRRIAENSIKQAQKLWDDPIVTELKELHGFYPAEAYHRDYYLNNPSDPYCQIIINPKLAKLRQNFAQRLK